MSENNPTTPVSPATSAPIQVAVSGPIEVNLLPDVKLEYLKTRVARTRVTTVAILVTVASLAITALIGITVFIVQPASIASFDSKIKSQFETYKSYNGVDQIITIQNQLSKIDNMHQEKPISSRLFNMIVSVIDGSGKSVQVSKMEYNRELSSIVMEGQSRDGFVGIEALGKSIQDTKIIYVDDAGNSQTLPMTTKVNALSNPSYGRDATGATVLMFSLGFEVDDKMFDSSIDLTLVGADRKDVTDSSLAIPKDIFATAIDNRANGEEE